MAGVAPSLVRIGDSVAAQQDYFWFLAALAALLFLFEWQQRRARSRRADPLACAAMAMLALAGTGWISFLVPGVDREGVPLQALSDWIMGLILAALYGAWACLPWSGVPRRGRVALMGSAALVLGAALGRWWIPAAGGWVLVAATTCAGVMVGIHSAFGRAGWWSMAGFLAAIWLSPIGPVAMGIDRPQRAVELTPLASICGLLAAGASTLAIRVSRGTEAGAADRAGPPRLPRRAAAPVAWLVAGLFAAWFAGAEARDTFERSALGRVRAFAANFETSSLEAALGPGFSLGAMQDFPQLRGGATPYTRVKSVEAVTPAMRQLQTLVTTNPDVAQIEITTLHSGRMWLVVLPKLKPGWEGTVSLVRPATEDDLRRWSDRTAWFERPASNAYGEFATARAALVARDGRILGWLQFAFHASQWARPQAQARLLTFCTLGAGVVIAVLLLRKIEGEKEQARARQAAADAAAASRMKTVFLANVSHELRTPLQSIVGYADLLLPVIQERPAQDHLQAVRRNGALMVRLVNDLIDLAALETGAFRFVPRPTPLAELVAETVGSLRPRAEAKQLPLDFAADPTLPRWVSADPERIRQIVLNLVGNAVKFTDAGRVEVRLQPAAGDSRPLVELSVADTGPGIPPADRARLFEPFSRLDRSEGREGSGLGLALCAGLLRALGGDIGVESNGTSGTTFRARWPVQDVAAPAERDAPPGNLAGCRVLVADDNRLVRELFVQGLSGQGAACTTAANGEEALQRIVAGGLDAVILDLAMPRMDGCEVTRRARAAGRFVRIVGVSAHAGASDRERARRAGMDRFLSKPVTMAELIAALEFRAPPAAPTRGPAPGPDWAAMFRAELVEQYPRLTDAWRQGSWLQLQYLAHYLKNSATVVRDDALFTACGELEQAARFEDRERAGPSWQRCLDALERWRPTGPAPPLPPP